MRSIYLDNNATTCIDPAVLDAMMPYYTEHYGNSSNTIHAYGMKAFDAVEQAKNTIAECMGAFSDDIIFTAGATESNNLAIRGTVSAARGRYKHIITSCIEHSSVLETCVSLEKQGVRVTYVPVDEHGTVCVNSIRNAITDDTVLISIMAANNEIGTIQPIEEISVLAANNNNIAW